MLSCKKWGCGELTTWILRLKSGFLLSETDYSCLWSLWFLLLRNINQMGNMALWREAEGSFFLFLFFKEFGEKNLILVFWPQCVLFNLAVWQGKAFWQWVTTHCFVTYIWNLGNSKLKAEILNYLVM